MPLSRITPRPARFATRAVTIFGTAMALCAGSALIGPAFVGIAHAASDNSDPVAAVVNGKTFHKSDVVALQRDLPQELQQVPLDQIYNKLVEQLVDRQLMQDAAAKANMANDPEVKKRLADLKPRVEVQVYVERVSSAGVTDAKLHALYDKVAANQKPVEEIHARHILVNTEDQAKAIIAQLDKGGDFAKIANEKSIDKGEAGGDLGWFTADKMVPEFSDAAFKLKKGEYTHTPVKSQFGWHVIQVLDTRQMPPPSFDSVKDQLTQQVQAEVLNDKVNELRSKSKVQEFQADGSPMPAQQAN
ncbi:MAG TPA: peptidylprolyl isomerase [Stellaceae bacterium]|nr:peptidylprolyl isomerase [Stellaceae bacterium]